MQDLPEELQEKVFLYLREPKDLFRVCSVSSSLRRICSGSSFWKEKFVREGFLILEEGSSTTQWLQLYTKAKQASRLTEEQLHTTEISCINLNLPSLSYLQGLEEALQPYYNKIRSGENIEQIVRNADEPPIREIRDDYFVFFVPTEGGYRCELMERRRIFRDGTLTKEHSRIIYASSTINSKQVWNILYRLFYVGILC
jgi:hypothetical protein